MSMSQNRESSNQMGLPCSTTRKKLVGQVACPIELNNVADGQLPASSGFHLTVDLNLTTLNQQLRLSARACNAAEFQELIEPQSFTFGSGICGHGSTTPIADRRF